MSALAALVNSVDQRRCDAMMARLAEVASGRSAFTKHLALLEGIAGDLEGKTLMDVGCGGGQLMTQAHSLGMQTTGIDIFMDRDVDSYDATIRNLRAHGMEHIDVREHDITTSVGDLGQYDFAVSVGMLEHIPDPGDRAAAVANMISLVKPGGTLLLECAPNRWSPVDLVHYGPRYPFYHWLPAAGKAFYLKHFIGPRHNRSSRPLTAVDSRPDFLTGIRVSEILQPLREVDPQVEIVRAFPMFVRLSVSRAWLRRRTAQALIRPVTRALVALRLEPMIYVMARRSDQRDEYGAG